MYMIHSRNSKTSNDMKKKMKDKENEEKTKSFCQSDHNTWIENLCNSFNKKHNPVKKEDNEKAKGKLEFSFSIKPTPTLI